MRQYTLRVCMVMVVFLGSVRGQEEACPAGQEDLRRLIDSDPILQKGTNLARACGASYDQGCTALGTDAASVKTTSDIVSYPGATDNIKNEDCDADDESFNSHWDNHNSDNQYLQIDLERDVYITDVRYTFLWIAGILPRRNGVQIRIGTVAKTGEEDIVANSTQCGGNFAAATVVRQVESRTCNAIGRYVYLVGAPSRLHGCEVEVFGYGGANPAEGLVVCRECPANQVVVPPSTRCSDGCEAGFGWDSGTSRCTECVAGKYQEIGRAHV